MGYATGVVSAQGDILSQLFPRHNKRWLEEMRSYIDRLSQRLINTQLIYAQLPWLLAGCHSTTTFLRDKQWIVSLAYRLGKLVEEVNKWNKMEPERSYVRVHPFSVSIKYPFQPQRVLGIAIAVRAHDRNYCLPDEALGQAACTLVPSLVLVDGSAHFYRDPTTWTQVLYCEVKKGGMERITLEERQILLHELPSRLGHYLRPKIPPVVVSCNEEEVLKGIVILSRELTHPDDLPQLILSFHQVEERHLVFTGTLVRLIGSQSPSIESLKQKLPRGIGWHTERVSGAGSLGSLPKEANSFFLRLQHKPFTRLDGAIDLRKARQYALHTLQDLFGDIRDYNGGWMSMQEEILEAAKKRIGIHTQQDSLLLENLFYSLTPREAQSFLCPTLLTRAFCLVRSEMALFKDKPNAYQVTTDQSGDNKVVVIIGEGSSWLAAIENIFTAHHPSLVSACFSHQELVIAVAINLRLEQVKMRACVDAVVNALKAWEDRRPRKQILRLSVQKAIPSLDPRLRSDRRSGPLMSLLYEGLMRLDPNGRPVPALAEKIDISPDRLHYRFHLRESCWSNGEPVTAHDFEYGWKKVLDPLFSSLFAGMLYCIKGAKDAKEGQISLDEIGVHAEDNHTLGVELRRPTPHFLSCAANWTLFPLYRDIDRLSPGWAYGLSGEFLCNGPFVPGSVEEDVVQLVKNPHYKGSRPIQIDRVEIFQGQSPQENIRMWKEGKLDWIGDPLCPIPSSYAHLAKRNIPLKKARTLASCCLYFNTRASPFSDKRKRQRIARFLQMNPLPPKALPSGSIPTQCYVSPEMGLDTSPLAFPDVKTPLPPVLHLTYLVLDELEPVCQAVATHLQANLGIEVVIEAIDRETFFKGGIKGAQLGIFLAYPWCADPISCLDRFRFLEPLFNPSLWQCEAYIDLLEQADCALGDTERLGLLQKAEELLLLEAPLVPLYFHTHRYAKQNWVKGSVINSLGMLDLNDVHTKNSDDCFLNISCGMPESNTSSDSADNQDENGGTNDTFGDRE